VTGTAAGEKEDLAEERVNDEGLVGSRERGERKRERATVTATATVR